MNADRIKLLAVDDDPDNLVAITAMLCAYLPGCEVATAGSGPAGLALARAFQPDTILLDVRMPGTDGHDVCRALKGDPATRHIPVVFLTAESTDSASRIRGLEIGGDAFLTKPVEPGELVAQVRVMVRLKQAEDALRDEKTSLERLVAERTAALEESEERYRTILDQAADAVFVHDATGRILDVNRMACQNLGYTREELLSKSIGEVDPEAIQIGKHESWQRILAGERSTFESRQVRRDGSAFPVEVTLGSVRLPRGPVILGIVRDITERRRAECEAQALLAAVQTERNKLQTVLNGMTDEVWFSDTDGTFTLANPRAMSEFAIEPGGTVDVRKLAENLEVLRPDGSPRPLEEAPPLRALAGEVVRGLEEIVRTPATGELRWRQVNAGPVRNADGDVIGSVSVVRDITDLKRAEEELRNSEEKFKYVFENSPLGKSITLPGGEISVNRAFCEMLGYSMAELADCTWQEITHPEDVETTQRQVDLVLSGEQDAVRFVKRYLRKDGSVMWAELSTALRRDPAGKPLYFMTVMNDITERKRTAEALQREQEFSRTLLDNLADGVVACDAGGALVLFNRAAREWHGMDARALPPEEWGAHYDLYGPDGTTPLPTESIPLVRAFRGETVRDAGMAIVAQGQPPRYILAAGGPFLDSQHNLFGAVVVMRDVTEHKQAEEALRTQAERLRNLHRTFHAILHAVESPEAIVQTALLHLRGLLHCQRASVGIFDLERRQVRVFAADVDGETIVETGTVLDEDTYGDLEVLRQGRMEIVEDMGQVTSPPVAVRILGVEGIRSSVNVPLSSAHGLYGALNVGWEEPRAITPEDAEIAGEVAGQITLAIEQARLLEETRRRAAELEQRVAERIAQLEAANRELEAFSYSVSHDLRAPLRAVDGYTRILLEDYEPRLDAEGKRVCSVISQSARDMGELVDDLLAFSRVGRAPLARSPVDMAGLARAVFFELTKPEERERVELRVGPLPPASGDPTLLRLVWVNLLSNALKFSSKRERADVEVSAEERAGEVVYSVRDNGVGFDMQYVGKLFGVFQRLHSTKEFEGTGVGLAIVQRILKRHGGRVWAQGEVGTGATFHFTFGKGE